MDPDFTTPDDLSNTSNSNGISKGNGVATLDEPRDIYAVITELAHKLGHAPTYLEYITEGHLDAAEILEIAINKPDVQWTDSEVLELLAFVLDDAALEVMVYDAWRRLKMSNRQQDAILRAVKEHRAQQTADTPATASPHRPQIAWQKATDLQNEELPEISWCIPDLLPEGAAILAGRPKKGKSLLALNIAIAKATGGIALGKYDAGEPADVGYLCLEDGKRRVKNRLEQLLPEGTQPDRLSFAYHAPRIDEGLLTALEAWITGQPNPALIVVDILAKIRPPYGRKNSDIYQADYEAIGALMALATRYSVSILIVHHTSKATAEDLFDSILGTTGISGATAINMVLKRSSGKADGELHISGKDIDDQELALEFRNCLWTVLGAADEFRVTREREAVLQALCDADTALTPKALAEGLDKPQNAIRVLLFRMKNDDLVMEVPGGYIPRTKGQDSINKDDHKQSNASNGSNERNERNAPEQPEIPENAAALRSITPALLDKNTDNSLKDEEKSESITGVTGVTPVTHDAPTEEDTGTDEQVEACQENPDTGESGKDLPLPKVPFALPGETLTDNPWPDSYDHQEYEGGGGYVEVP